jgi:large subunit ribosomal protein L21
LTKISGIGKVINRKLKAIGITTFAQIASWDQDDVAKIETTLAFKNRIARENWIAQAKQLAEPE